MANVAGRAAQRAFNYWMQQAPANPPMPPINTFPGYRGPGQQQAPRAPPRKRRGGGSRSRGRGRGQRQQPQAMQPARGVTTHGSVVLYQDLEIKAVKASTSVQALTFRPSGSGLSRLDNIGKLYKRWKLKFVNIAYKSVYSTTTDGVVTYGIMAGGKDGDINTEDKITKLRPMERHAVWKSTTISVGPDIQSSPYLYTDKDDVDGVAFTVYLYSTKDSTLQFSYMVELSFPHP